MSNLSAIRNEEASPYDSLSQAKAILRESAEQALLERRRKEKQRGLQSSMLEYTEHARRVREAHLQLQARGKGNRGGGDARTAANQLVATVIDKPRKGRSPLRVSNGDLRRLYGNLANGDKRALGERYLPDVLQPDIKQPHLPARNEPEKRHGEGTDYWDIVTKDGEVKRIVILRTDDRVICPRQVSHDIPHRRLDEAMILASSNRQLEGFVNFRSDGSEHGHTDAKSVTSDHPLKQENSVPRGESEETPKQSYHSGILPRPRPSESSPVIHKPKIKIEVSLPRMEFETPSPDPSDSGPNIEEENALDRKKIICLKHGFDISLCKKCSGNSQVQTKRASKNDGKTQVHRPFDVLRVSTQTYPIEERKVARSTAELDNCESQKIANRQEGPLARPEVSHSSLSLGDELAYQRAFTVNTSVQSLPTRMEVILKNAMDSAMRDPASGSYSESPREAEPAAGRSGPTCRHGQIAVNCNTCRTLVEIQRRLKTSDFRREMRQSFQWDLQAGKALSKSSRWDVGARDSKSNLGPHLKEMWTRRKKDSKSRQRRPAGDKTRTKRTSRSMDSSVDRSRANSILKANTESMGRKKSVRFSEEDVYHPMTGYHPTQHTDNLISAS